MAQAGEDATVTATPSMPVEPVRAPPIRRGWPKFAIGATLVMLLVAGIFFYLSKNAPPEAARLLPESDGIVFLDAGLLRAAIHFDTHPVKHDPDYQRFIDGTGIEFERDLEKAAFALHQMSNPLGPNGPVAFSSIFVGKFDRLRLANYLAHIAQSQEHYAGHDIYDVPVEGRTDRIAILDGHTVAVSNTPTAEQIHSILDRQRSAMLPFSGNSLLSQHFKDVPLFSSAWGIGKLGATLGDGLKLFGFRIPLSVDAIFVGSIRWTGALHLRIEEIAPNGPAATLSADSIEALLSMARTAENVLPNAVTNPDAKTLLDSVEIEHHNDRAVLTATIPLALLQKLGAGAKDGYPSP